MSINPANPLNYFNVTTTGPIDIDDTLENSTDKKVDYFVLFQKRLVLFNWGEQKYRDAFKVTEGQSQWKTLGQITAIVASWLPVTIGVGVLFVIDLTIIASECVSTENFQ